MDGSTFAGEPLNDSKHASIHGPGWIPDFRDAPSSPTSARAVARRAEQGARRPGRLFDIGVAVLFGIVMVVATFYVVSEISSLLSTPSHRTLPPTGPWKIRLPVSSLKQPRSRVAQTQPRSRVAQTLSIGACLSVDGLAAFGLIRLRRRRRTPIPPPLPSHRRAPDPVPPTEPQVDRAPRSMRQGVELTTEPYLRRASRSMRHWIVLTLLALVIVVSPVAILMALLIDSNDGTFAYFSLTPVLIGAMFAFVRVWRCEKEVHTGDVRGGRLWSHDEHGNTLPALPLWCHGRVRTSIAEGDRVEVRGRWNERRKVFVVESCHNLTTHVRVNREALLTWLAVRAIVLLVLGQFLRAWFILVAGPHAPTAFTLLYGVVGMVFLAYVVGLLRSDRASQ